MSDSDGRECKFSVIWRTCAGEQEKRIELKLLNAEKFDDFHSMTKLKGIKIMTGKVWTMMPFC